MIMPHPKVNVGPGTVRRQRRSWGILEKINWPFSCKALLQQPGTRFTKLPTYSALPRASSDDYQV